MAKFWLFYLPNFVVERGSSASFTAKKAFCAPYFSVQD